MAGIPLELQRLWHRAWLPVTVILTLILCAAVAMPWARISHVTVQNAKNARFLHAMLPFSGDALPENASYVFDFSLDYTHWHPRNYQLTWQGCLHTLMINGRVIIAQADDSAPCSNMRSTTLPLGDYLNIGENRISISLEAGGGKYRFSLHPIYPLIGEPWFYYCVFAALISLLTLRFATDSKLYDRPVWIWVFLACVTCLMRVPFFFNSLDHPYSSFPFIWWDESTFLNMGQHIVNGHLPYLGLWDNKPPLLFLVFAALITLSGGDLAIIRLLGSLLIATTAYALYLIGKRLMSKEAGWYMALLYAVFSANGHGAFHSLLADHMAVLPLAFAIIILLDATPEAEKSFRRQCFWIGLLTGTAAMLCTQYWLLAPVFAGLLATRLYPAKQNMCVMATIIALSSMIPFLTLGLPYVFYGETATYWRSIVTAGTGHTQLLVLPISQILWERIYLALDGMWIFSTSSVWLPYVLGPVGMALCLSPYSQLSRRNRLYVVTLFVMLNFAAGLRTTTQFYPPHFLGLVFQACMMAGLVLAHFRGRWRTIAPLLMATGVYYGMSTSFFAYETTIKKLASKQPLKTDLLYHVAATINDSPLEHPVIFTCETEQVLYFLTHSSFPMRLAHPHIITWELLPQLAYNHPISMEEIYDEIRKYNPAYIIGRAGCYCFKELGPKYMQNYTLIYSSEDLTLWQHKAE